MYTPTYEILLHSQRAFDLCRTQVYDYEDCLKQDVERIPQPKLCMDKSLNLLKCYNKVEQTEPICMDALNDYRECMFKFDGAMLKCEAEVNEFNRCQENPKDYVQYYLSRHGRKTRYNLTFETF